jgi:hypothetical protein
LNLYIIAKIITDIYEGISKPLTRPLKGAHLCEMDE